MCIPTMLDTNSETIPIRMIRHAIQTLKTNTRALLFYFFILYSFRTISLVFLIRFFTSGAYQYE